LVTTQALVDFVVELTSSVGEQEANDVIGRWILSVGGASNLQGSGAEVILKGPDEVLIEQWLRFAFKESNNQAEYEALIVGMCLAADMGVKRMLVRSDSQLVTEQVAGNFQDRDPHLARYLSKVREMALMFDDFGLVYVPQDQNSRANLLSKLASTKRIGMLGLIVPKFKRGGG